MMRLVYCGLFLILLVGCGSDRPPMGRVSGTVSFNGNPIQEGTIIFEVPGNRTSTGKIVDGQIKDVTAWEPGDGVPVGVARIAIQAVDTSSTASAVSDASNPSAPTAEISGNYMGMNSKSLIPARYGDPASSDLTFEIQTGENVVSLDLKD